MKKSEILKLEPKDFYQRGMVALESRKLTKKEWGKLVGEYLSERRNNDRER